MPEHEPLSPTLDDVWFYVTKRVMILRRERDRYTPTQDGWKLRQAALYELEPIINALRTTPPVTHDEEPAA